MRLRSQLCKVQRDCEDTVPGGTLEPIRELVFFRVIPLQMHRQKVVSMPAAAVRRLSQQELSVTVHAAHCFGTEHVVSVEASQSTAIQNPVSVLSLWNIELKMLVEELTAWITRKSPRYVVPALSDRDAQATETAVRKLTLASAFPGKDSVLPVAHSDGEAMQQLQTLLDLGVATKLEVRDDCSMWSFADFGASQLRVASQLHEPEMVFSPLEDLSLPSLEDASCWQLFNALKEKGFQVRQRPRKKNGVLQLPPHTPDNVNLVWYASGASLQHLRKYMIALVHAENLFAGGVVLRIHHCQPASYYSQVLQGYHSGSPLNAIADEARPALQLDAENVFVPQPAAPAIEDAAAAVRP